MEIKKKVVNLEVYEVGYQRFTTEEDAKNHLEKLNRHTELVYYTVYHAPDTTEGRGYGRQSIFALPDKDCAYNALIHYLYQKNNGSLTSVMGYETIPAWKIGIPNRFQYIADLKVMLNKEVSMFGSYFKREVHYLNENGEIIDSIREELDQLLGQQLEAANKYREEANKQEEL